MKRRTNSRRRLGIEALERRTLLAGNVTTQLSGGLLYITGDRHDNALVLTEGAQAGQYVLIGLDAGGEPTKVNRRTDPVTISGVTQSVWINLGRGNDSLAVTDADFPRDLVVIAGSGNDAVAIGNRPAGTNLPAVGLGSVAPGTVRVERDLVVTTAAGDDDLVEAAVLVGRDHVLIMAAGHDEIELTEGDPALAGGVSLGVRVDRRMTVDLGAGNDTFDVFASDDTDGDTDPALRVVDRLNLAGGNDADEVRLDSLTVLGRTTLLTSVGNDSVHLDNVRLGRTVIDTSTGQDAVEILNSQIEFLRVNVGFGNDTLAIGTTTVSLETQLDGSSGNDTFDDLDGNTLAALKRRRFDQVL